MTQMGLVDGEFIVNPSQKQWDEGDLQLTVASTAEKVIMIEAGANEIPEDQMIEAIYKCHDSEPDSYRIHRYRSVEELASQSMSMRAVLFLRDV